jgi:PAS domain S-box-containing protein
MLSPDGRIISWNAGAQRLKQYIAAEILGRHFSVFYPPEQASAGKCESELETASRDGRFEEEGWRLRKDGSRFWAHVTLTRVRGPDGSITGFAKVTRDLTARKRADEERIRLAQAQEAVRLRDEFLVIAAHELRTPLTALGLQLQRLQRSGASPPPVEVALRSARRLGALIETLFDVSRIAMGQLKLERQDCDLADLAREVVGRWSEDAARGGCELQVEAPVPVRGRWDPLRVDQVIENLIGNAIKYAAGKPVRISVGCHGNLAELSVADQGPGVAPGDQHRIFNRFERAVDARHYGGLGLGLFIAREIVEAHGGSIAVESGPGRGAIFRVALPVHP